MCFSLHAEQCASLSVRPAFITKVGLDFSRCLICPASFSLSCSLLTAADVTGPRQWATIYPFGGNGAELPAHSAVDLQ